MGWDAYCTPQLAANNQEFKEASKRVLHYCSSADGGLSKGSLGLSDSARMLEKAFEKTGEDTIGFFFHPYQDDEVTPEQVKILSQRLNWNFYKEIRYEQRWAYWSAKEFIETCALLGLGIRFSY
ncbi:hypothetical protein [Pedobacter punctiformis]|uniref:Polysaccharide deacetylase n=1 Tax=Pedobacter punctiformis TaxID=3004097 RepID=A0ABT4LCT5_9SPHI|nr:hypothetical protein [Pedobacter sp. HCMS5-2]MCZ4244968.1 hypothetical protein [Pedobacter sp. HCMS5-2]